MGRAFLGLGLTSFGGPTAHLAYFHRAFVERRGWLSGQDFAEIVAVSQALPGPASSQAGLAIGWRLAGWRGALAAFVGFTTPSAILMLGLALAAPGLMAALGTGWLVGLKAATVAVVLLAALQMARQTAPDAPRFLIMVAVALGALMFGAAAQLWLLGAALALGAIVPPKPHATAQVAPSVTEGRTTSLMMFGLFCLLLAVTLVVPGSPVAAAYRAGALVFGGGHAVLPLLEGDFVGRGWVDGEVFLAGYGAAQALPGPLFTFAAYLGTAADGPLAGVLALIAVFLPGALLVLALEPLWPRLRRSRRVRGALAAAAAAATGLLAAAFLNVVAPEAFRGAATLMIALGALVMLAVFKSPAPVVIALAAILGAVAV